MRHYYTLIASLPVLPHPQRAQRLPINAARFAARLRMLAPDDARVMQLAEELLEWQRQPVDRSDAEFIAFYERLKNPPEVPSVWQEVPSSRPQGHYHAEDYSVLEPILTFRLNQRTLLAALRRRHLELAAPEAGEAWGIGSWVEHIRRHWDAPDFKLTGYFPWLPEAKRLLEQGDSLGLESQQMHLVWQFLERYAQRDPFSFAALLAYRFQWDILQRYLSYNPQQARKRLEQLLTDSLTIAPESYLADYLENRTSHTPEVSYAEVSLEENHARA
jgi:hypothetical protein